MHFLACADTAGENETPDAAAHRPFAMPVAEVEAACVRLCPHFPQLEPVAPTFARCGN